MYGLTLKRVSTGHIGTGLEMASRRSTTCLIPPDMLMKQTSGNSVVEEVCIFFKMVPGFNPQLT